MDDVIRRRALVHGTVQGVGYRFSTEGEADRLGLAGFVRNRADGTVEVEAEGTPEAVGHLLAWLEDGPDGARVIRVDVDELAPTGEGGFETRH